MRCASNVSRSEYMYTLPSAGSVNRCSPSPLREYAHSATMTSSLLSARPPMVTRSPWKASRGVMAAPLRVISLTSAAARLRNVLAPGRAEANRTRDTDRNVVSPPVRSSSTW